MAVNYALHSEFPVAAYKVRHTSRPRGDENFYVFRNRLLTATSRAGLNCWSPFASIPASGLDDPRMMAVRADDPGRALILGWLFRIMGVSPYLIFWIAPLLASAVLLWSGWELWWLGCRAAAAAFMLFTALSTFVAEALALEYSAAGFYLVALLLVVPLSAYASSSRRTPRGVLDRALAAGAIFGAASLARSASFFVAPVLLASVALAARGLYSDRPPVTVRIEGLRSEPFRFFAAPRWVFYAAAAIALFCLPYLALRSYSSHLVSRTSTAYGAEAPEQRHDVWLSVWEGLGDFDRTKGHVWLDASAQQLLGREKVLMTPGAEKIFRRAVLTHIRQDPGWFARILLQRLAATVFQRKLWPWGPLGGVSIAPQTAATEGVLDGYYSLVTPADWFGIGMARVELPVPLLIAFAVLLVALTVRPLRRPGTPHGRATFVIVGALAIAAVAMPIAITTAGAIETQAFMLVYVLAAAFVLDAIVRAHERRRADASKTTAGPQLGDGIQTGPDVATAMSPPRHTREI